MKEIIDDWTWWKPRLITLFVYVVVCFLLTERTECVSQCGSYYETNEKFTEGYVLYLWLSGHFTSEWITAIATVFIGWFTLTLRRSTDKLWHESQTTTKKLEDMIGVMASSIAVTGKSADAAQKAADIAEQAMVADKRPWVKINEVKQTWGADDKDGGYHLDVAIKNVGNSPATCIYARAVIVGNRFPKDDEIKQIVETQKSKTAVPGVTLVTADSVTIDAYCVPDDKIDVMKETNLGVLVCCVYYSFPFKATQRDGHYVSAYRVSKESLINRELVIALDIRYAHAE